MNRITALLPMRAGSQRVKNKNIRIVKGKPLYIYILKSLYESKYIDKIIINTDIQEIISRYQNDAKIKIINREEHLKGNCSMNMVIENTLAKDSSENYIQLHATNPLLKPGSIDMGIKTYFENKKNYDSLFSVNKIQKRFWTKDWVPLNHNPADSPTTQDLEIIYEENSCFYIFSKKSFFSTMNRIGKNPYLLEISSLEAIDIDTEEELEIAEKLLYEMGEK